MPQLPDVPSPLARGEELLFGALSALRGSRALHPDGAVFTGRFAIERGWDPAARAGVLAPGFAHDAVVRLSRAIGLPRPLPDILGVAFRLPDVHGLGRHQDVLLSSSVDAPVLHHLFVTTTRWFAPSYTTSLPYRAHGAGPFLLGLVPPPERGPAATVAALEARLRGGPATFGVAVAPLLGRWRRIGTLTVERRARDLDDTRFDPWQTGGGLVPSGTLNALRLAAYRGSRLGPRAASAQAAPAAPPRAPTRRRRPSRAARA